MRPVAKLDHETDPPDSNSHHADSDAKIGCRVDRTGDNPDDASADDAERNEIAEDRVASTTLTGFSSLGLSDITLIWNGIAP